MDVRLFPLLSDSATCTSPMHSCSFPPIKKYTHQCERMANVTGIAHATPYGGSRKQVAQRRPPAEGQSAPEFWVLDTLE